MNNSKVTTNNAKYITWQQEAKVGNQVATITLIQNNKTKRSYQIRLWINTTTNRTFLKEQHEQFQTSGLRKNKTITTQNGCPKSIFWYRNEVELRNDDLLRGSPQYIRAGPGAIKLRRAHFGSKSNFLTKKSLGDVWWNRRIAPLMRL